MQYAPTRVYEKFGGFHIPAHGCAKNAPDFTIPNRDTPKTHPVLDPNRRRWTFRGVCNTPLHGYTQKIAWFHISAHGCAKNAPDFTHPNKDTPKTCPILHPNRRRGAFRGVCNTPLHVYVQNLTGFIFPHTNTPKTHPILGLNLRRGYLKGVCNTPLHGYTQNPPDFRPKPLARNIWRRMLLHPYTGTCKIRPVSYFPIGMHPKPTWFYTQTFGEDRLGTYAIRPYTGTCKI